jgi:hypothetical protein
MPVMIPQTIPQVKTFQAASVADVEKLVNAWLRESSQRSGDQQVRIVSVTFAEGTIAVVHYTMIERVPRQG